MSLLVRMRAGGWIGIGLLAAAACACTGPNPGYRIRPVLDGGGGSTGTDAALDSAAVEPLPGPEVSGPPPDAPSADGEPEAGPLLDAALPPDTMMPPPDMALLPPDMATPPPDMMTLPPDTLAPDTTPAVNLDDRLRAHWTFNEGSGTRVADRMGGNTGTLQAGASFVRSGIPGASASNHAARFQGTDDHMTIAIQSLPTLQVAKSIALWINPDDLSHSGMRTIVALATSNDSSGIQIGTDLGRPAIWRWGTASGTAPVKYAGTWTDRWYHLVYTFDTQTHRLYVDGTLAASAGNLPVSGTIGNAVLACYDKDSLGWEMYEGLLDDLRIYDKVLGPAEIARLQQGE